MNISEISVFILFSFDQQTGNTALMMAVIYGERSTIRLLLKEGADLTIQNKVSQNY